MIKKFLKKQSKNFREETQKLRGFDFNSMDIKESGSWPSFVKVFMIIILCSLILFLGNNFIISKLENKYRIALNKEVTLLNKIAENAYVTPTVQDYENQLKTLEINLESIKSQLPEKIEMSSILDEMTQLAATSNVFISTINLNNEKETENYIELPFKITAKGRFHNFAAFLSELSRMHRIVTVHEVTIVPSSEKSLLELEFVAKTYKYKRKKDIKENVE